ncbi:MAG: aminotransferase class I/II-fold pyridoxal phosphate-dependent enzyme [Gemmatimonadota bacterium]|nr:aminotransferase class I/II-fold pyridoxal phosphate-dependent enzyme [Gemmatimonadota bacterium]MDH3422959.1 aminotransferase class I/II-fold pyridoxal phosphate-dependent enzyme [Gemmatimonadota bacterium]
MNRNDVSRRNFVGGAAAALGTLAIAPEVLAARELHAAQRGIRRIPGGPPMLRALQSRVDEYDALAHLSSNENPFGPSQKTLEAMTYAFKYSMRYGYPDNDVQQRIADAHGVDREHLLLGAGSGEILEVVGLTYLGHGKKVIGVEPSYGSVYSHATGIDADNVLLPLEPDHRQNVQRMVDATNRNYRDVGFVYVCNPNNPTGVTMTAAEIEYLLDNIPEDVPVLIDEAYHHFVEDPEYEESIKYALEGRKVIIARTFSKLYGMAAMRIGFAIAPADMIQEMRAYSTGSVNALARWGAVAGMQDTQAQKAILDHNRKWREQTIADLAGLGYESIPSQTNFFMVNLRQPVAPIRQAFRERKVAVGRDFPPMLDHLRVSIGTEEEMGRFMNAFEDILKTSVMSSQRG